MSEKQALHNAKRQALLNASEEAKQARVQALEEEQALVKQGREQAAAARDGPPQNILVTGGNAGIGLALCKQLALDHGCHVFMGSRSEARGNAARQSIIEEGVDPSTVEVIQIDVSSVVSCTAAAEAMTARLAGASLYGLVNNAGTGLSHGRMTGESLTTPDMMEVNHYGVKRVSEAFLPLLDATAGRIVNVGSAAASMWLQEQSAELKALFSCPESWDMLDFTVKKLVHETATGGRSMANFGLSKAAMTAHSILFSEAHPNLVITTVSPGFIDTKMTDGLGAKVKPENGTLSIKKCLFEEDVTSGYFYGSDGLRSPIDCARDPDMPEYQGESDPDPAEYDNGLPNHHG